MMMYFSNAVAETLSPYPLYQPFNAQKLCNPECERCTEQHRHSLLATSHCIKSDSVKRYIPCIDIVNLYLLFLRKVVSEESPRKIILYVMVLTLDSLACH